jgi:hypothetical protein
MQSPCCEPCLARGRSVPGNTVDHVVAVSRGGHPFPPLDGLMTMCAACHSQKTSAVERAGGSGLALKGCGPDGLPLDPKHHAWGYTPSKDQPPGAGDHPGASAQTYFERRGRRWD